jgi:NAD(P)-dependent dehydrogenase (short-subunit alcohol dehydrogenase family)
MNTLNAGRVAIVTGAGAGIGRSHALALAASGAKVVVNDVATAVDGDGRTPAEAVVAQIGSAGGTAVVSTHDISNDAGAQALVAAALSEFGDLHALVNNAGVLRDRMLVSMTEQEWDAVIAVHLKGTFGPSRHAALYWRQRSKTGADVDARIVNTTSASGVFGNVGQSNYGAAKAGIAAFTIITAMELSRYGITVNAVAPRALTAMTETVPRYQAMAAEPGGAKRISPDHISPVVTWLASPLSRTVTGRVFGVAGTTISVYEGWHNGPTITRDDGQWEPLELAELLPGLVKEARPNADMTGEPPSAEPSHGG